MYWNPFDSAHSGRINSSSGRAAILRFILAGRLWVVGFFFLKVAGRTRIVCKRGVIETKKALRSKKALPGAKKRSRGQKKVLPGAPERSTFAERAI
jgi:hypothetical protein